ncbi:hypothetical protein QJS04_geneDACA024986 [Acorus gramineus]|uniref:Uncharacterized protein n=1 Tax=Acorus gramineus TaxID=55184 RepID=A0AAV9A0J4_ACOGR|nr:hypothetical protein QJS04_geneDACA024986 [Acorus gramineus]
MDIVINCLVYNFTCNPICLVKRDIIHFILSRMMKDGLNRNSIIAKEELQLHSMVTKGGHENKNLISLMQFQASEAVFQHLIEAMERMTVHHDQERPVTNEAIPLWVQNHRVLHHHKNDFSKEELDEFLDPGQARSVVKVKLPEFNGQLHIKDYLNWLGAVEHFFDYIEALDAKKTKLVAIKLKVQHGGNNSNCLAPGWENIQFR